VMAAITATLAVSIKISAKSKPANARTFDMGTTLKYPDTDGREPDNRGEIVIAEPRSPH
jgi:hypothetical protein